MRSKRAERTRGMDNDHHGARHYDNHRPPRRRRRQGLGQVAADPISSPGRPADDRRPTAGHHGDPTTTTVDPPTSTTSGPGTGGGQPHTLHHGRPDDDHCSPGHHHHWQGHDDDHGRRDDHYHQGRVRRPRLRPYDTGGDTTTTAATTTTTAATTTTTAATTTTTRRRRRPVRQGRAPRPPASLMPDSLFNSNVQSWAVDPGSAGLVNNIVAQYESAYGQVGVNFNRPVYDAASSTPDVQVNVDFGLQRLHGRPGDP